MDQPAGIETTKASMPVEVVSADDALEEVRKTGSVSERKGWRESQTPTTPLTPRTTKDVGATPLSSTSTPIKK